MRASILSLFIFLTALAAAASPFRIDPPAPDTRSFVSITIGGLWPDSCVPHDARMTIAGSTITIVADAVLPPGTGCLTVISRWQQTVRPGLLPPGVYDVLGFIDRNSGRQELGRTKLIVRDAGPFRASPSAAPISGGTEIRLVSETPWSGERTVLFGDVPVQATAADATTLVVTAPAHAAGTVDVNVGTSTARQAFTFYDPAEPTDASIFEPLLFPIAFSGEGAFGSKWVTDNVIAVDSGTATFHDPLPCGGCSTELRDIVRLDAGGAAGLLLYAARGTTAAMTLSSRVRDLSRQAESAGTGIPVIRENDWYLGSVRLIDIPAKDRGRATLRIWSDHDRPVSVAIVLEVPGPCPCLQGSVAELTRAGDRGPLFAQIDLRGEPRSVRITSQDADPDVRLWALVTITNNTTQQVTAIWPD